MQKIDIIYTAMNKNNKQILDTIDKAIKKCREIENKKFPYAVIVNIESAKDLHFESLTYLPKNGFKSIPIIKSKKLKKYDVRLAYSEKELIKYILK